MPPWFHRARKRLEGLRSRVRGPALDDEVDDLKTLLCALVVVPFVWAVVFRWTPSRSIMNHDGVAITWLAVREYLDHGGDWTRCLYRPELLGGVKLHDQGFLHPIFRVAAWLRASPTTAMNLCAFFIQDAFAFLGLRTAVDLARMLRPDGAHVEPPPMTWFKRVGLVLLFAFTPYFGWRLSFGHENLILGSLLFSVLACWIGATATGRLTSTLLVVSGLAFYNCVLSCGHQLSVYSLVFGAPILLGMLSVALNHHRAVSANDHRALVARAAVPTAMMLGACLLAMPRFAGMLAHFLGPDVSRRLDGPPVVYSLFTSTAADWLGSIPWSRRFIPAERTFSAWHETNFPLGPSLLLLFALPRRRAWPLLIGLALSFTAALLFSMNVAPVSTLMVRFVPLLASFRVPSRAMFPFGASLPLVVATALISARADTAPEASRSPSRRASLGVAAAALTLTVGLTRLPPAAHEAAGWIFAAALVWMLVARSPRAYITLAGAWFLGLSSVSAFKERTLSFWTPAELVDTPARVSSGITASAPALRDPLTRAVIGLELTPFRANTPLALRVSSLDGYWLPNSRFLRLMSRLSGVATDPTQTLFQFTTAHRGYPVWRQLYNVRYEVGVTHASQLVARDRGLTVGPAWFSAGLSMVPTIDTASAAMLAAVEGGGRDGAALIPRLRERMIVVQSDALGSRAMSIDEAACARAEVLGVESLRGEQRVDVRVQTHGRCPLSVALNYAGDLRAWAERGGAPPTEITLFPAYGALIGAVVPAGTTRVRIEAVPIIPGWAKAAGALGPAMLALSVALTVRLRRREALG